MGQPISIDLGVKEKTTDLLMGVQIAYSVFAVCWALAGPTAC